MQKAVKKQGRQSKNKKLQSLTCYVSVNKHEQKRCNQKLLTLIIHCTEMPLSTKNIYISFSVYFPVRVEYSLQWIIKMLNNLMILRQSLKPHFFRCIAKARVKAKDVYVCLIQQLRLFWDRSSAVLLMGFGPTAFRSMPKLFPTRLLRTSGIS